MAGKQLLCDSAECSESAGVFGFCGGVKTKACLSHMFDQIGTGVPFFPISAFHFVESETDGPLYEQRQREMKAGLANITSLEARSDEDLAAIRARMQQAEAAAVKTIKTTFKRMIKAAEEKHQIIRKTLGQRRRNLGQFATDKSFDLSPEDRAICQTLPSEPLLIATIGNFEAALTGDLLTHCQLIAPSLGEQVKLEPSEGTSSFHQLGTSDEQLQPLLIEEEQSRSDSESLHSPSRRFQHLHEATLTAEEYLVSGQAAYEAGDYFSALTLLQQAKELTTCHETENPELSLHLGLVLAHFGRRDDAEAELKRGLCPDPPFPLSVQLRNELAELYFQTEQWQSTATICEYTLRTWTSAADNIELLRLLYYLSSSYYQLDQRQEGDAVVSEWTRRLVAESSVCKGLLLFIQAGRLRAAGDTLETIERFEQGLKFDQLPHSYITATSRLHLGGLYDELNRAEAAEEQYRQAHAIYSQHFPHSLHYCICLTKVATLYTRLSKKRGWTATQYNRACSLFAAHFPESLEYAKCLVYLGLYYESWKQRESAEKPWQSACELYEAKAPHSLDYAVCLYHLGDLYDDMKQAEKACQHWRKACDIYRVRAPESLELASCLNNLGFLYLKSLRKLQLAEDFLLQACRIYLKIHPNSVQYANCLYNFAQVLKAQRRSQAAIEKLEEASELFKRNGEKTDVERCQAEIKRLSQ